MYLVFFTFFFFLFSSVEFFFAILNCWPISPYITPKSSLSVDKYSSSSLISISIIFSYWGVSGYLSDLACDSFLL
jgi:hypothetical protein